jgi:uncharacterized membrane protein
LISLSDLKNRVFVKQNLPEIILVIMVALYFVIFSYLTILKMQALGMHTWDFGLYLQSIHTTATSGKLFFTTAELPYTITAIPAGTEFAVHFSPILFLVVPIYAVFQNAATLLVIKSFALALGAIPVFMIAKKSLNKPVLSLIFAAGYLLFPALHGVNWWDFEPQVFFIPLALFTIMFIEYKKIKWALFFSVLASFTVEIAPFFIIALGLSYLVKKRKTVIQYLRQHKFSSIFKSAPALIIFAALIWLVIIFLTLTFLGWQTSFHLSNQRRVSIADSANILGALSLDWQAKLLFIGIVFGPFLFLAFLEPWLLLPGGMWIAYSILSNYSPYYSIGFHYLSFVIPFVVTASIFGFKKLFILTKGKSTKLFAVAMCIAIAVSTVAASPIGPYHVGNNHWIEPFGVPTITAHDQYIHNLADLIPADASVLAGADLFPLVANRLNAYVFPLSATFPSNGTDLIDTSGVYSTFNGALDYYLQKVDYVFYDGTEDIAASVLFPKLNGSAAFGVYGEADGALLLKKNFIGEPVLFVPFEKTFTYRDLILVNSTAVTDSASTSGKVICHYSPDTRSDCWYGPGFFLSQGKFLVSFTLKYNGNTTLSPISLAVINWPTKVEVTMEGSAAMWYQPNLSLSSGNQKVLTASTLEPNDFSEKMKYQTFSLQFDQDEPGGLEFVGLSVPSGLTVFLDNIELLQVFP